jgi:hypothetical protein
MNDAQGVKRTSNLGVAAIILAMLGLFVCWIPIVGFLAYPLGIVGGVLAVVGVVLAMTKGEISVRAPLAGMFMCGLVIVIPIFTTAAAVAQINTAIADAKAQAVARQNAPQPVIPKSVLEVKLLRSRQQGKHVYFDVGIKNTAKDTLNHVTVRIEFFDASDKFIGSTEPMFSFLQGGAEQSKESIALNVDASKIDTWRARLSGAVNFSGLRDDLRCGEGWGIDETPLVSDSSFDGHRAGALDWGGDERLDALGAVGIT